jgi:LmbE family N-acetylglucosaminyl deacetylase
MPAPPQPLLLPWSAPFTPSASRLSCSWKHGDLPHDRPVLRPGRQPAAEPDPAGPQQHHAQRHALLSYEVASSTEWQPPGSAPAFQPNWFVDISAQWERKRQALEAYDAEMRPWPHARSIEVLEHLARWCGAQVGVEAAEASCLLRQLR